MGNLVGLGSNHAKLIDSCDPGHKYTKFYIKSQYFSTNIYPHSALLDPGFCALIQARTFPPIRGCNFSIPLASFTLSSSDHETVTLYSAPHPVRTASEGSFSAGQDTRPEHGDPVAQ